MQVCEGWRGLAVRLGLATFVPDILCCREKCKLRILLDVWKEESSSTFTVDTLKTILCQEVRPVARRPAEVTRLLQGHTDMYNWVCLMTASRPGPAAAASPFRRNQFSSRSFSVSRPRPQQPPLHRPVRSSPMRDFLYSPATTSTSPQLPGPASPYSSYFGRTPARASTGPRHHTSSLSPGNSTRTSRRQHNLRRAASFSV